MKVLAYIPLHYGTDYLKYAIQSVYSCVDEILILYTSEPSHGHRTDMYCPDSMQSLQQEALANDAENKVKWHNGIYTREGIHRDTAFEYAKQNGFDVVIALDSDEVWKTDILKDLIREVYERRSEKCLICMRHLWRSFNYICDDPMRQERIYYVGPDKTGLIYASQPVNHVWHFGYARELKQVEYKISIHGHSNEWILPKQRWFDEKYRPFPPAQDVHPTCKDTWNPKPFDRNELPDIMREHAWFDKEIIE